MKNDEELKPCPFCGGRVDAPEQERAAPGKAMRPVWTIECCTGYCVTMRDHSRKDVVRRWNTRDGIRPDGSKTPARLGAESVA